MSNAPSPERYTLGGSEDSHQIALMIWAQTVTKLHPELKWMFAIPNGGSRHKAEAGKLKAMGVKAGVPDIFLPVSRGSQAGLWIELKKPVVGKVSSEQNEWLEYLRTQGYAAAICYGWTEARDIILNYLKSGK